MMKLPLSVTTGPAFARAMRRVAFGESSFVRRLRRTEVCANGETSMGTPGAYLGIGEQPLHGCWGLKTHAGAQDGRVLSVVSDNDEPVGDSQRGSAREDKQTDERLCCLGEHLLAQLTGATAFDAIQFRVDPSSVPFGFSANTNVMRLLHLLIRAVDGDIKFRILRDITETQASERDELL